MIGLFAFLDALKASCLRVKYVGNDNFQSKFCAEQLKALGEPLRLRIVDVLRHGEMTVGDIAEFLEVEVVTVSHHLKILKTARLVEVKREGRYMIYSLNPNLLNSASRSTKQYLNLGCCRLEIPANGQKPEV
jgi:DNA-binding transcriptional ArsR family regulator